LGANKLESDAVVLVGIYVMAAVAWLTINPEQRVESHAA
jgi:hypothetical protein